MRKWILAMACVMLPPLAAALLSSIASAQGTFPSRPVRAILPYSPGTTADLIARNLGPQLSESWNLRDWDSSMKSGRMHS